jgi:hypothetical protein
MNSTNSTADSSAWFGGHADLADAACKLVFVAPSRGGAPDSEQPFKNIAILNTATRRFRVHTGELVGFGAALALMGNNSKRWKCVRLVGSGESSIADDASRCRFAVEHYPFDAKTYLAWEPLAARRRTAAGPRVRRKRSADEAFEGGDSEAPRAAADRPPRTRLVVPDGFVLERVREDPNKRARVVYRHEASGTVLKSRRSAVKYVEGGAAAVPAFGPGSAGVAAQQPACDSLSVSGAGVRSAATPVARAAAPAAADNERTMFAAAVALPDDDDALWDADLMESESNTNDDTPDLDDLFAHFQRA